MLNNRNNMSENEENQVVLKPIEQKWLVEDRLMKFGIFFAIFVIGLALVILHFTGIITLGVFLLIVSFAAIGVGGIGSLFNGVDVLKYRASPPPTIVINPSGIHFFDQRTDNLEKKIPTNEIRSIAGTIYLDLYIGTDRYNPANVTFALLTDLNQTIVTGVQCAYSQSGRIGEDTITMEELFFNQDPVAPDSLGYLSPHYQQIVITTQNDSENIDLEEYQKDGKDSYRAIFTFLSKNFQYQDVIIHLNGGASGQAVKLADLAVRDGKMVIKNRYDLG
ncbi:MAG: hypothetical protein GF308_13420 [Candidatus Heimdallarchaeota archaeon]|nr:hypothetical protein [Candidatus Heimdallarchaeota archaeon]